VPPTEACPACSRIGNLRLRTLICQASWHSRHPSDIAGDPAGLPGGMQRKHEGARRHEEGAGGIAGTLFGRTATLSVRGEWAVPLR
jgi:hypothetical protein